MVKIAICDDEQAIAQNMKDKILKNTFEDKIEIDIYSKAADLYAAAVEKRYEILFLDIELDPEKGKAGVTGMELSNKIKNLYPDVLIIFFTGNEGYEIELLNFEPFRFRNKPVLEWQLVEDINSAIKRIKNWEDKFFTFSNNKEKFREKVDKIVYFSSASPYITIKTIDGEMRFREKMDQVEHRMMKISEEFYRVSKGHLINRNYVKKYTSKEIMLESGEKIPVSRKYMSKLAERMKKEVGF